MRRRPILLLLGIVLLGLAIRIYKIDALPLYGDELTMVYDTYSISKTGMDATGQKFPLTFKMGAGRPGGYIYFSVPFVAIFGPTVWGVRGLSLLSGLGIIVLMYFLGKKLFNEKVGLIAAFLMSISPWDIYLSRGGFEAHFALFLALLGITMFFYKKYFWWGISWGIALFTYPTFKLTLPLMFLLLGFVEKFKKLLSDKKFIVGTLILFLFGAAAITQTFFAGSETRFFNQNILSDNLTKQRLIQIVSAERTLSTLPSVLKPVFINREIEYGKILLESYFSNISPNFLFIRGDGNPRHNPGEMGMLYLAELPILLISIFILWKENKKMLFLLSGWILITPLATMFMQEAHALRNGLMLPPLILLTAYAISRLPRKFVKIFFVIVIMELIYILVRIYTIAPAKFASFWSAEAKEAAVYAIEADKRGEYVTLFINRIDNIEYAYEVYAKVDPREAISQYGKVPKIYGHITIADK